MKNILFLSILTILSASLFAQDTTKVNGTDSKQRIAVKEYSCPMHPEIVSNNPGKCSKCGMDLILTERVGQTYSCPMHPEIVSDKPGKCSKCGMDLTLILKKTKKKMKHKHMSCMMM